MKEVTKLMIKDYKLNRLKYDFMGYTFNNTSQLSFHHLIIPHRDCKRLGYGDGYYRWNGAILRQNTSHEYLHVIENYDRDRFLAISNHMIEMNVLERLDKDSLKAIRDVLLSFEREYRDQNNKKGKRLIKPEYINNRIKL